MSLEAVIAENTAAMKELTALLKGAAIPFASAEDLRDDAAAVKPVPLPDPTKKPKKAEKPVEQPKDEVAEGFPAEDAPDAPDQVNDPPGDPVEDAALAAHALTYDEVAKSVKTAAMCSRAKAMEILASFKIKHLSEAKPAQYPAIKAALDKIVAGAP